MSLELLNRGHNVTVVSSDIDSIQLKNLHQIHMERVYINLYNSSEVEFNSIEIGTLNPFVQLVPNLLWAAKACEGFINSKGWQQLQNYPDNFKVYYNRIFVHDPISNLRSVRFSDS